MNVLMLRHSASFEHSYLPNAEVTLKELGIEHDWNVHTTNQCNVINKDRLKKVDVLVFATAGQLPFDAAQKRALLSFVRSGKGFFGIHNATDTFHKWPAYGKMTGGYFNGHPWSEEEVGVKVEDRNHPATRHLPKKLKVLEEVYTFNKWDRKKTHVLMSLDNKSVDISKGNRKDNDYAMAWCHDYGKGRVIYSALGHYDSLWYKVWFRQHLVGCINWAAGEE